MGIENRETSNNPNQVMILQKDDHLRQASPQVQEERLLVLWAKEKGRLGILTDKQRPVVEERYLSRQGVVISFGLIARESEENNAKITRAALHLANRGGITKLVRVSKGEEPIQRGKKTLDIAKMKKMLNEGWNGQDVADELGCSRVTLVKRIRRYRDELGLNIKRGRPRKNIVQ